LVQRKPPIFAKPSFFADIVQPSAWANISPRDVARRFVRIPLFAKLDEVRVLREPARVNVQRNAVLPALLLHFPDISHGNRWPRRNCW